jgi:hypothetical protein
VPANGALILMAFRRGHVAGAAGGGHRGLRLSRFRSMPWVRRAPGRPGDRSRRVSLMHLPATHELMSLAWLCLTPAM